MKFVIGAFQLGFAFGHPSFAGGRGPSCTAEEYRNMEYLGAKVPDGYGVRMSRHGMSTIS